MRFIKALLQVEREFTDALVAVSVQEAGSSLALRQNTRRVTRLMANIEVLRKSLEARRLQLLA